MQVYIKVLSGVVHYISTDNIEDSIPIEVDRIEEIYYKPGYDKKLINNKLVDVKNAEKLIAMATESAKQAKLNNASRIKVTVVTNKTFDGDEKSQDRMLRAINIASITGQTTTQWKLADNSIVMVTLDELKEALVLAGQEMSRIWLEQ